MYSSWSRSLLIWRRLAILPGMLICLIVILPWLLLVQIRNPEFFQFFFIHEQFQRFSTDAHSRTGAWWYYLPVLIVGLMPWTPALFAAVRQVFTGEQAIGHRDTGTTTLTSGRPGQAGMFDSARFCLCWSLLIIVFFSISHSKLPGYVNPAFPALALLIARQLRRASAACLYWCAGCLTLVGLAGFAGTERLGHWKRFIELTHGANVGLSWVYCATVLLVLGGVLAAWLVRRKWFDTAIASLAFSSLLAWSAIFAFMHEQDGYFSSQRLVAGLTPAGTPFSPLTPFYSLDQFDHSLPFYLGRSLTLVAYRGELGLGIDAEPHKAITSMDEFVTQWRARESQAYAVMSVANYEKLAAAQWPMRVLRRDQRLVIVSRLPDQTGQGASGATVQP